MTMNTAACKDFCNAGELCLAHGNYDEAIDNYLHAFAINDTNEIGQQLARLYFIIGSYDEAMKYYLRFFAISYKSWLKQDTPMLPDFITIYYEVGCTYLACSNRLKKITMIDYLSQIDTFNHASYCQQLQTIRDLGHAELLNTKLRTDRQDIENIGYKFLKDVCSALSLPPFKEQMEPLNNALCQ